jgi:[NiFe] hydrogenase diaphorase moiety large subunit
MSHCGLGQSAANHILDSLKRFRERYEARLAVRHFVPDFDLDGALAEARALTGRDDALAHLAR